MTSWIRRQPIQPCKPRRRLRYERFVKEVQPTLDKMTCTQARCHGSQSGLRHQALRQGREKTLRAELHLDAPEDQRRLLPFSEIMLHARAPAPIQGRGVD